MNCNLKITKLKIIYNECERKLLNSRSIKFEFDRKWSSNFPSSPGVYAIYENNDLLYIGETANLKERMKEVKRTYNHSFRKKLGKHRFYGKIEKNRKYSQSIEIKLDEYFKEKLFFKFIEVNFGRLEIESFLIEKYKDRLLNSESKRKTKSTKAQQKI